MPNVTFLVCHKQTLKALSYVPELNETSTILDIGCGTGAQTITLAKNTKAQITAIDMLTQFLEKLMQKARENNLQDRITAKGNDDGSVKLCGKLV